MTVWVVRHAKAGSRRAWSGEDARRPLSKPGRAQADGIAAALHGEKVGAIVSSPYVRCHQTVEPLAAAVDRPVVLDDRLAEGAGPYGAIALVREVAADGGVLCSHGDVIGELLSLVARAGVDLGRDPRCEKGSVWTLELEGDAVVEARYTPPPS